MILRYPGGKTKKIDRMRYALPQQTTELRVPFFGGGSDTLTVLARPGKENDWVYRAQPGSIWLNDKDKGLAALWSMVIQKPGQLCQLIEAYRPREEDFYTFKKELLAGGPEDELVLAFNFLVLNRISYNGLGVKAGKPVVPVGSRWNADQLKSDVLAVHKMLAGKVRENRCTNYDFEDVIRHPGDCWFLCDPPYVEAGESLYPHHFVEADHRRLADALHESRQPFLLTYDDTPLVRRLYQSWAVIETIPVRYAGSGKRANEVLIYPEHCREQVYWQGQGPIQHMFGADSPWRIKR